jgi:hypothetical protein
MINIPVGSHQAQLVSGLALRPTGVYYLTNIRITVSGKGR